MNTEDDGFFDGLEELDVDALIKDFSHRWKCDQCGTEISIECIVSSHIALELVATENPSWSFSEDSVFCSESCESDYGKTKKLKA